MNEITPAQEASLLDYVQQNIQSWWDSRCKTSRELIDAKAMSPHALKDFIKDNAIDPALLRALVRRGPPAADEMPELMQALNIDANAVRFDEPALYRDMQVSCSLCPDKKACRKELANGTAAENYTHFCVNEAIMSELRAHPDFQED